MRFVRLRILTHIALTAEGEIMHVTERRIAKPIDIESLGIKHPGLIRVNEENRRAVEEDDEWWQKNTDSNLWLSNYLLLQHLLNAQSMLVEYGNIHGREDEFLTRSISGFNHDISKIKEPYRSLSRKNGNLTDDERVIMKGHTHDAADMVNELKNKVRPQDQTPFEEAEPIVRYHDEPYQISNGRLRRICWDLWATDHFLAATEKRHDSDMTDEDAIRSVRKDSVARLPSWARNTYWFEIRDSIRILPLVVQRTRTA
jgi:hypothetical protein